MSGPQVCARVWLRPVLVPDELVAEDAELSQLVQLRYDASDPLAVQIIDVESGACQVVARDLLETGLRSQAGAGLVQVRPVLFVRPARVMVVLRIVDPDGGGWAELAVSPRSLSGFLRRTYALVPAGEEDVVGGLDVELAALRPTA